MQCRQTGESPCKW